MGEVLGKMKWRLFRGRVKIWSVNGRSGGQSMGGRWLWHQRE
jgi:hypothetical protein